MTASDTTRQILGRFNAAFVDHRPHALDDLIGSMRSRYVNTNAAAYICLTVA